jgi:hypothetical protein
MGLGSDRRTDAAWGKYPQAASALNRGKRHVSQVDGEVNEMGGKATRGITTTLLAGFLAFNLAAPMAHAQEPQGNSASDEGTNPQPASKSMAKPPPAPKSKPETAASWHARRGQYFQRNWGVDIVGVRPVSSGYMLRFDYRVVDPGKASALSDRKARPYLIDEKTRTALAIPAMEKIGELRQVAPLEENRTYYMIFGNPGKLVKRGSHVTIVVGNFRAEGMVVD